jgi:hypothetical protein
MALAPRTSGFPQIAYCPSRAHLAEQIISSNLSMFQKIGVAGPSRTPESEVRQALAIRYCPSGYD